jgi:hypothetical protein
MRLQLGAFGVIRFDQCISIMKWMQRRAGPI